MIRLTHVTTIAPSIPTTKGLNPNFFTALKSVPKPIPTIPMRIRNFPAPLKKLIPSGVKKPLTAHTAIPIYPKSTQGKALRMAFFPSLLLPASLAPNQSETRRATKIMNMLRVSFTTVATCPAYSPKIYPVPIVWGVLCTEVPAQIPKEVWERPKRFPRMGKVTSRIKAAITIVLTE